MEIKRNNKQYKIFWRFFSKVAICNMQQNTLYEQIEICDIKIQRIILQRWLNRTFRKMAVRVQIQIFSQQYSRSKDYVIKTCYYTYSDGNRSERGRKRPYITLYRYHMHEVPSLVHDCQCTVNDWCCIRLHFRITWLINMKVSFDILLGENHVNMRQYSSTSSHWIAARFQWFLPDLKSTSVVDSNSLLLLRIFRISTIYCHSHIE